MGSGGLCSGALRSVKVWGKRSASAGRFLFAWRRVLGVAFWAAVSKPLGPEYEILVESHKRDLRLEAEARDPWRAFLASVSNFIIFAIFGLAVVSGLAVIVYVAIDLLRR